MSVPLFSVGDISFVFQVVILFLLIFSLLFIKGNGVKKNLKLHGYLTVLALVLHTILIVIVMIPEFTSEFGELVELSFLNALTVWSHVILGTLAEILGFIVVGFWVSKPLSKMACERVKKVMLPLFVVWAISLITGALMHILDVL